MKQRNLSFMAENRGARTDWCLFAEGVIHTVKGDHIMSPEIGAAVIADFEERGNDLMFDIDHGAVTPNSPPKNRESAGWARCPGALTYRAADDPAAVDGPGLYVTGVEWRTDVKAGLEEKPVPRWRYWSPAFFHEEDTGAITQIINVAITNLPATHNCIRLASMGGTTMDQMELVRAGKTLLALMDEAENSADETIKAWAAEQLAKFQAALGDNAAAAIQAATEAAQATTTDAAPTSEAPAALGGAPVVEEPAKPKETSEMSEEDKKAAAASTTATTPAAPAAVAPATMSLADAIIAANKAKQAETVERARIIGRYAKKIPAACNTFVRTCSIADLNAFVATLDSAADLPTPSPNRAPGSGRAPVDAPKKLSDSDVLSWLGRSQRELNTHFEMCGILSETGKKKLMDRLRLQAERAQSN